MFTRIERNAPTEGSSPGAEGVGGEEREVTIVEPDEDDQDALFIKNFLYDEKEMNKFLDNMFVEVGNHEVRNVGSTLREACQEKDLTQLIRGSSHLAAIYFSNKMAKLLVKGGVEKAKAKVRQSQGQIQKKMRIVAEKEMLEVINGDGGTGTGSRNVGVTASSTGTISHRAVNLSTQDQPGTCSTSSAIAIADVHADAEAEADRAAQVSSMEHFRQNQLEGMPVLLPLGTALILEPSPSSVRLDNDNDNSDADAEDEEELPPSSAPTLTSGITPGKRLRKRTICYSIDNNAGGSRRVVETSASASRPSPTPPITIQKEEMTKHQNRMHKQKRPFKCPFVVCDKTFPTKYSLKSHEMIHRDERPFECGKCYQGFKRIADLRRHVRFVRCVRVLRAN